MHKKDTDKNRLRIDLSNIENINVKSALTIKAPKITPNASASKNANPSIVDKSLFGKALMIPKTTEIETKIKFLFFFISMFG